MIPTLRQLSAWATLVALASPACAATRSAVAPAASWTTLIVGLVAVAATLRRRKPLMQIA